MNSSNALLASDWPDTYVKVSNLDLDSENPRLSNPGPDLAQREIIRELVNTDKIAELAKRIALLGFFPTESIVVLKHPTKRSRYIVLEGNRRVTALKALISPEVVPAKDAPKFEALKQQGAGRIPDQVRAVIAPSRVAARPYLLTRHTTTSVESWSAVAQARFVQKMVEDGFTPEAMAQTVGMTLESFAKRYREGRIYQLALNLPLEPELAAKVRDTSKFPISTLTRICESAPGREWLGLETDDLAGWKISTEPETFKKALAEIIKDISAGDANSRSLNNNAEIIAYLDSKSKKQLKPKQKKGRPAKIESLAKKSRVETGKTVPPKLPSRNTTTLAPSLLPGGVKCDLDSPRIHAIIHEIDKLDLHKFPNAAAMLFRGLLDMLLQEYLVNTSEMKNCIAKNSNPKNPKGKDWCPSLPQMLNFLVTDLIKNNKLHIEPSALKVLNAFISKNDPGEVSLSGLDGFAHNRLSPPISNQLLAIAERLRPLLTILLEKP